MFNSDIYGDPKYNMDIQPLIHHVKAGVQDIQSSIYDLRSEFHSIQFPVVACSCISI